MKGSHHRESTSSGRLRIGDHWNAITILALSQNNPLKAVAEFVENSIDARARRVVINNGHRDFVFASKSKVLKLRYITRLFSKELVLRNFAGLAAPQLLERLIELTLRAEENLK